MREEARTLWHARDEAELVRQRTVGAARPEDVDEVRVKNSVARQLSVSVGHFEQSWEDMARFDVTDRLGELRTPTLMIAGASDGLVRATVEDYLRLPRASLHVMHRVGRGVPTEATAEFTAVLADFLANGVVNAADLLKRVRKGR